MIKTISWIILVVGLSNVTGIQYMIPTGREKLFSYSIVFGAIINFLLNYILIPIEGAMGACISSLVAECAIFFIQAFILKREIEFLSIFKDSWKYFVAAFAMILYFTYFDFDKINIVTTIIISILGTSVYFLILLLFKEYYISSFRSFLCSYISNR